MYITTKTQEIIDAYSTAAGTGIFVPEIETGVEDFCGFVDDKKRERGWSNEGNTDKLFHSDLRIQS